MKRKALLIGINKYQTLGKLSYARQDAEAFADVLCKKYGFSSHDIHLMTCQAEGAAAAFSRYIELAISDLVGQKELDLLVFGFWGHGFAPEPGKRYLCGLDTIVDDLERTAVSMDVIRAKLSQVGADNTLLVLDCCQNKPTGRSVEAETLSSGEEAQLSSLARDIQAARREQSKLTIPTVAILNSCREGQRAYEWNQREHGIFTAHLLDQMDAGTSSIAQLASSIFDPVTQTAINLHRQEQTPFVVIEGKGDIDLPLKASISKKNTNDSMVKISKKSQEESDNPDLSDDIIEQHVQRITESLLRGKYLKKYFEEGGLSDKVQLWHQGAEKGCREAQWLWGWYNEVIEDNISEGIFWHRKAAEQGCVLAQVALGLKYKRGKGVTENPSEAIKWFQKAADQGNFMGQFHLGLCYYLGQGVQKDNTESVNWLTKSAEQGYVFAQHELGLFYARNTDNASGKAEAFKWFLAAAKQDFAPAQRAVGICYNQGDIIPKDFNKAVVWFKKAAEQGYSDAQSNLGLSYYEGEGVTQDYVEAVKWFRKAAEQGDLDGQHMLGCCLINGEGVQIDKSEGAKWIRKAAEQGNVASQYLMGGWYEKGLFGLPENKSEAIKWYRMAAKKGYKKASEDLARLEKKNISCFLTTSICESLNKPDDCHELHVLRQFRDTFMQETGQRRAEVSEYYRIAPKIVEAVNAQPAADVLWGCLASKYILPCIKHIENNCPEKAYLLYGQMVHELKEQYLDTSTERN